MQETITLKHTLTEDVKDHLDRMTPIDFQALMELYRKEREGLNTIKISEKNRLNQSLWEKLAERKQRLIDQGIEEEDNMEVRNDEM